MPISRASDPNDYILVVLYLKFSSQKYSPPTFLPCTQLSASFTIIICLKNQFFVYTTQILIYFLLEFVQFTENPLIQSKPMKAGLITLLKRTLLQTVETKKVLEKSIKLLKAQHFYCTSIIGLVDSADPTKPFKDFGPCCSRDSQPCSPVAMAYETIIDSHVEISCLEQLNLICYITIITLTLLLLLLSYYIVIFFKSLDIL